MNERIENLAKEAGAGKRAGVSGYVFRDEELEKFTKLIVKECTNALATELRGVMKLQVRVTELGLARGIDLIREKFRS